MARKGSGLRTAIKIAKAIDKAGKQAAREAERRQKQEEREFARQQREIEKQIRQEKREHERQLKLEEKEDRLRENARITAEKESFKNELENAKLDFDKRCLARQELRNKFVDTVIR